MRITKNKDAREDPNLRVSKKRTRKPQKKIAVVHDWLNGYRGGEKVLQAILELLPENTPLYTLVYEKSNLPDIITERPIHTSIIQKLPLGVKKYKYYLPLFAQAIEGFDMTGYDTILSTSHAVAKGIIPDIGAKHLAYLHSPMRYIWDQTHQYFNSRSISPKNLFIQWFLSRYRMWDIASNSRVDRFIANSSYIKKRMQRYYGTGSAALKNIHVVHPYYENHSFTQQPNLITNDAPSHRDYLLVVSALVPYKRIDIAIEAAQSLGRKLKIVGSGPEEKKLKSMANSDTEFLGWVSNEELLQIYSKAQFLLFPGIEDFGITPLEAMANNVPVIAYNKGGVRDTVSHLKTGYFYDEMKAKSMANAIVEAEKIAFKKNDFEHSLRKFTKDKFKQNFLRVASDFL